MYRCLVLCCVTLIFATYWTITQTVALRSSKLCLQTSDTTVFTMEEYYNIID